MEEKFTIQEFKNYIIAQEGVDLISCLSVENIRKANEPVVMPATTIARDIRFSDTEEMFCPKCNMPTPHVLRPISSSNTDELWTCTMQDCGHPLS